MPLLRKHYFPQQIKLGAAQYNLSFKIHRMSLRDEDDFQQLACRGILPLKEYSHVGASPPSHVQQLTDI
ncbi:Hypothetical predicted protein [Podarcis lilfordi]|uniref:Uncharacterized protein n=1 Tax=Podarcis lilfordi TaxID=74358 RepID=A0AA35KUI5_9SAUR|nr:Hypothetical predicted protein [Podarcis lilfordi]